MTETFIEKSTFTKSAFCGCFSLALLYFKFGVIKVFKLNYKIRV